MSISDKVTINRISLDAAPKRLHFHPEGQLVQFFLARASSDGNCVYSKIF